MLRLLVLAPGLWAAPKKPVRPPEPAFHRAAEIGDVDEVRGWLDRVDVDLRCGNGWTALTHAAAGGQVEVIEILVKAKADLNVRTKEMWTPLIAAALSAKPEAVDALLAVGADPNAADKEADTALMKVCTPPSKFRSRATLARIGKALLKAGADPNFQNLEGLSAVMLAAASCNEELLGALLKAKGDPNAASPKGKTPLRFARQSRCPASMLDALRAAGAKD